MGWRYLELADYLVIAEAVLDIPAEALARLNRLDLADSALNVPSAGYGDVEAYPSFEAKAAVLCWHLVKNHPLPDGIWSAPWNNDGLTVGVPGRPGRPR